MCVSRPTREGIEAAAQLEVALRAGADEATIGRLVDEVAAASTPGSGNRVVIGAWQSGAGYIGEAVEGGSIFFDTGDEVWEMLHQSGTEWSVNKAFLRRQLEARVDQIEFVGEEVDTSIRRWRGVAIEDIPNARYQEVMWLYGNASDYGYSLEGNAWRRTSQ